MHYKLHLAAALDAAGASKFVEMLHSLDGVAGVTVLASGRGVGIDYDADLTSPQELQAVAARAGHTLLAAARHTEGSCCGGCGG